MKQSFILLIFSVISQLCFANAKDTRLNLDTIPIQNTTLGIQIGTNHNNNNVSSFKIGAYSERRISSLLSLEGEIMGDYKTTERLGFGKYDAINLDLSLSARVYFTKRRKLYCKVGYYGNFNLKNKIQNKYEANWYPQERTKALSGLQVGIGNNWTLKNNRNLKLEGVIRTNKIDGLNLGLRIGMSIL